MATLTAFRGLGYGERMDVVPAVFGAAAGLAGLLVAGAAGVVAGVTVAAFDDIAALVRFLAGPESTWITGQTIGIDGGHHLRRGPDYTPFAEPLYGADALRGLAPERTP